MCLNYIGHRFETHYSIDHRDWVWMASHCWFCDVNSRLCRWNCRPMRYYRTPPMIATIVQMEANAFRSIAVKTLKTVYCGRYCNSLLLIDYYCWRNFFVPYQSWMMSCCRQSTPITECHCLPPNNLSKEWKQKWLKKIPWVKMDIFEWVQYLARCVFVCFFGIISMIGQQLIKRLWSSFDIPTQWNLMCFTC